MKREKDGGFYKASVLCEDVLVFTINTEIKIAAQKMQFSAIPSSKPKRSLAIPTIQGPNIPPSPPKARKMPRVRPGCPSEISEMIAVEVGKMIE